MDNQDIIEIKQNLISVMQEESLLLDTILQQQELLHKCVKERNWKELEDNISNLQSLSDKFAQLENERISLSDKIDMVKDKDVSPVLALVRGKLQKSKIENKVLNEYIKTTRKFLQGVFDDVVPQRRNTLYSRNGSIVKPGLNSLVLNQIL